MTQSQAFSGFPLVVGELYGIRVWSVDDYGRLRARHVPCLPWRPGVNTAVCYAATYGDVWGGVVPGSFASSFLGLAITPSPPAPEKHDVPDERCKCGFYAYTSPTPETYDAESAVVGIIRGTGRTLVGTKGFRCEKAEIVALIDPAETAGNWAWRAWLSDRLRANYPDVPLLGSREELARFAPIDSTAPSPDTDEFWDMP